MKAVSANHPPGLERATRDIRADLMVVARDVPFLDAMVKNQSTQRKMGAEN
jgi:hypothetical protein